MLDGAFQAVFHSAGVAFDPQSGAFHFQQPRIGLIGLTGDGLPALWTRRALERLGYAVNSAGGNRPAVSITVLDRPAPMYWRIERAGEDCECGTLAELLDRLNDWMAESLN